VKLERVFQNEPSQVVPAFELTSSQCKTFGLAQEEACMQTFAFLLAVAPQAVKIHKNSVRLIGPIRDAAQAINTLIKDDSAVYPWVAAFREAVIENPQPDKKNTKLRYVPPTSDIDMQDKEKETLAVLKRLKKGVEHNPSQLGRGWRDVIEILGRNLRKGGLREFLEQRPEDFTVHAGIGGQVSLISLPHPEHVAHNFSSNDLLCFWCSTPQRVVPSATSTPESANIQGLGGGV
jgi:hypothetical protein